MRLRTITAKNISEALAKVQRDLGPDALVLETRTDNGRAEVVAADVEQEAPEIGVMRLRAEVALLRREMSGLTARAAESTASRGRFAAVEKRLLSQGVAARYVDRLLAMISHAPREEGNPIHPAKSDVCRSAVAGVIPGVGPVGTANARCFAFVGPAGAGKTTTIAKLLEQSKHEKHDVGVISLDGGRPGGTDVLSRTAERLGLPFGSATGPDGLLRAIDSVGKRDRILIDTAGLGARESAALEALRDRLASGPIGVHLVMPANLEGSAAARSAEAFMSLRPSALVFTKLDETERLGNLINLPASTDLPVAALAHGPSVKGDLSAATRHLIADLVLGRRGPLGDRE